jgi:ATP-dependent DNA helicase DinG
LPPSRAPLPSAAELLGPDGPLPRELGGYEVREGQLEMARAVEATFRSGGVLLVEAGTGTGKTLAYLVPAILSRQKFVVSTATRALQDQILAHDLPLIRDRLGIDAEVALMKGLGNYLCRRRHAELVSSDAGRSSEFARALGLIDAWLGETRTGDLSELGELAEDDPIWSEVAASSDTRVGSTCQYFDDCFITHMKRQAELAQVVVVNHHLFFADLALRGPHPGRVIPDYQAVVFDEAHQLEEVATGFFGLRVSRAGCERLLRDARRDFGRTGLLDSLLGGRRGARALAEFEQVSAELWSALGSESGDDEPRVAFGRDRWAGDLARRYHAFDSSVEAIGDLANGRGEPLRAASDVRAGRDALEVLGRRSAALRDELARIVDGEPGQVTWLEADRRNPALGASPVELADLFRQRIFDRIPCVVLTSATLSGGPSRLAGDDCDGEPRPVATEFGYLRSRLGLETASANELVVRSPFDFPSAAIFYTPRDLPDPADPGFLSAAVRRTAELVRVTGGGAFVLATSLRSMHGFARGLGRLLPDLRLLVQGRAPKQTLLEEFRYTGHAVLVATMSFWEGVDVPGHALRLVVLEKIPFAVPTDPVVRARAGALEARGRDPFMELLVPAAAITLKQGFGRLIRTRLDRGVVALLDGRVLRRGYGKRLIAGLPPASRTTELEAVRVFWTRSGSPD